MERHQFTLEINSAGYSSTDEHWRTAIESCRKSWLSACGALSHRSFEHEGKAISIEFDWRPAVRSCEKYARAMELISNHGHSIGIENWPFQKGRTKIPITLVAEFDNRIRPKYFHPDHFVRSALSDVFLILNISDPGCCDFYKALLKQVVQESPFKPIGFDLSFAAIQFEISRLRGMDGHWPPIEALHLPDVAEWYFAIRSGLRQVPQSDFEKVFFAMLHVAAADLSPTSVIWLYYALETLLGTKPGENRAAIERRATLLLRPTADQRAEMKKALNRLYDYRSSLVHGGLQIIHPIHCEALDRAVDAEYDRLMDLYEVGFSLLLAIVQSVIKRGWTSLNFCEQIVGKTDGVNNLSR